MRHWLNWLVVVCFVLGMPRLCPAQNKLLIMGDSYSTFDGFIPEGYKCWYFADESEKTDVHSVEQTWWWQLCNEGGYELLQNNSYSGSTICNIGYSGNDYSDRSFVTRALGLVSLNPDLILIFGGTNDSWANSPVGEVVPSSRWREADLKACLPAMSYLLGYLREQLPQARIVVLINDGLKESVTRGFISASLEYDVEYLRLMQIDKLSSHPSVLGMQQIARQVLFYLN